MKKTIWWSLGMVAALCVANSADAQQQWKKLWYMDNPTPAVQQVACTTGTCPAVPAGYQMTVELLTKQSLDVAHRLCQAGKYTEAAHLLSKVAQLNPNNPHVQEARQRLEQVTGKRQPVEEVRRFPRNVQVPPPVPARVVSRPRMTEVPCPVCAARRAAAPVAINQDVLRIGTTCACGTNCSCGTTCACGPNCACGKTCACGANCSCGKTCKCGPNCQCKKGATATYGHYGQPTYQVMSVPNEIARNCPVMSGRVRYTSRVSPSQVVVCQPVVRTTQVRVVAQPTQQNVTIVPVTIVRTVQFVPCQTVTVVAPTPQKVYGPVVNRRVYQVRTEQPVSYRVYTPTNSTVPVTVYTPTSTTTEPVYVTPVYTQPVVLR